MGGIELHPTARTILEKAGMPFEDDAEDIYADAPLESHQPTFGDQLKLIRRTLAKTQAQMAELLAMDIRSYQRLETRDTPPRGHNKDLLERLRKK